MAQKADDPVGQTGGDPSDVLRLRVRGRPAVAPLRSASIDRDASPEAGPIAYTVAEVLRRLSVTRPTIYRFLRSGELRSFRLGSRRLVSAEALADFIRSRESAEAG